MTSSTRPMPQSGGVRHSRARRVAVGPPVGEAGAHVVQQQIGVGADRLVGEARRSSASPVCSSGRVARRAAEVVEQLLALGARGRRRRAARARRACACRTSRVASLLVVELGLAAVDGALRTPARRRCTACSGCNRLEVMPMSPLNAPAFCCSTVATLAFHPKRPSDLLAERVEDVVRTRPEMPSPSASSGSASASDVVLGNRLEQSDTEDRRRDARRHHARRRSRAGRTRGPRSSYAGAEQRVGRPVARTCPGPRFASITMRPSAGTPLIAPVLQLVAVHRVGNRPSPSGPGDATAGAAVRARGRRPSSVARRGRRGSGTTSTTGR